MYIEDSLTNSRGEKLATHTWKPSGTPKCLVFMSHGFSEHLGLYHEVAHKLNDYGYLVFGHDHVGHGKSDGKRVYIENVDDYCDDVILHCLHVQEKYPDLKMYIVGHSMGGMITIRSALMQKELFHGMVLNGPLVVPGPQVLGMDFRATPFRTFISRAFLSFLSWFIPETSVGGPNLNFVTRDLEIHDMLNKDLLRWTGGCKVRLLLAFVNCLDDNINSLSDVRTPFLVLHGSEDILCNPVGSHLLYRRSRIEDKQVKIFEGSMHQLFLEIPAVRQEAFKDVGDWIESRL